MLSGLYNLSQAVTLDGKHINAGNPLGVIKDAALLFENGRFVWIGTTSELPAVQEKHPGAEWVDGRGLTALPGLIDSHTHTVFAGNRAPEFEMRLQGKTYLEIAQAGGGILKTVEATRAASEQELTTLAEERIRRMMSYGVTTVEVKSGYGLDFETEMKCLRVIDALRKNAEEQASASIVPTYMGAHDIPPEYKNDVDAYVEKICAEQIPAVAEAGLAAFCDVFCEKGYFTVEHSRRILETARAHGLKLKIHAEEFCDFGGAELAGELRATSADHLLHISDTGIAALKAGGPVATLLPGTAFYLRIKEYAPARKLLDAGVPVALATDFNPGSCMSENLQLTMTLACLQMNMEPVDVIKGVTINAAKALDLEHDRGSLSIGKRADLALFAMPSYHELLYHVGVNKLQAVYTAGRRHERAALEAQLQTLAAMAG